MDYTYATIIVTTANQTKAQDIAGADTFLMALSADGLAPATHYVASGPFSNDQMNAFTDATWPKVIRFGTDWQAAITEKNLMVVVDAGL